MKVNVTFFTAILLANSAILSPIKADTKSAPETTPPSEMIPSSETTPSASRSSAETTPSPETTPGINNLSEDSAKAFIKQLQTTLTSKKPKEIHDKMGNLIHYPLRWIKDTKHPKKSTVMIKDKKEFLSQYDEIMTPKIKAAILKEEGANLLINAQGCMIGKGQVWFDEEGITTLNSF